MNEQNLPWCRTGEWLPKELENPSCLSSFKRTPFLLWKCHPAVYNENLRKPWGRPGAFSKWCKPHWLTVKISLWGYLLLPLASRLPPSFMKKKRDRHIRAVAEGMKSTGIPRRFMPPWEWANMGKPGWEMASDAVRGRGDRWSS